MKRWIHAAMSIKATQVNPGSLYPGQKVKEVGTGEEHVVKEVINNRRGTYTVKFTDGDEGNYDSSDKFEIDYDESIDSASRDIEYKIKDYIAAWAKDDVKEGKPMANFKEYKEEMKSEGLKADEDGYDYYVACYNNACKGSNKKVSAASKADATNELSAELLSVFDYVVGPIWRILESDHGGLIVVSEDTFTKSEAERVEIKLNNELKRLGLSKHVSRVAYYFAGTSSDDDSVHVLRIAMYLKRYVEL